MRDAEWFATLDRGAQIVILETAFKSLETYLNIDIWTPEELDVCDHELERISDLLFERLENS